MNNTQGGVNPSGYSGSGYGMATNRLLTQTPAVPDQDVHQVVPATPAVPPTPLPWWKELGHPAFNANSNSDQPLGILGFRFGQAHNGSWRVTNG